MRSWSHLISFSKRVLYDQWEISIRWPWTERLLRPRHSQWAGVRKLTAELVCSVVSSSSFPFSKKMLSWIQDLFRYIQMRSWSYRIQCKSTMFLRLSTGEWSSMNKSSKVYLPFAIDDTHISSWQFSTKNSMMSLPRVKELSSFWWMISASRA